MAPTVAMGPLANGSISNLARSIPNYLCTNSGAFIKKCTIDQLIRSTIRVFVSNKNSQVEVCFYVLRNTPVDIARVHYHRGTGKFTINLAA